MATGSPRTNTRNSSARRITSELRELSNLQSEGIYADCPNDEDLHELHFTIRGPQDSEFEGGLYHGRILLPHNYPFSPPDIMLLTPSGRFELNKKICLSITGYHQESWQPAWGIRLALIALQTFLVTEAKGAIGSLEVDPAERKRLAKLSRDWTCPTCQIKNCDILPPTAEKPAQQEADPSKEEATPKAKQVLAPTISTEPQSKPDHPILHALPPGVGIPRTPSSASLSQQQPPPLSQSSFTHVPPASPSHDAGPQMRIVEALTRQISLGQEEGQQREQQQLTVPLPETRQEPTSSGSRPPIWLDGSIGLVAIALASLLCRKML